MVFSDTTNKNGILQRYERYTLMGDGVVSGDTLTRQQATADINETVYDLVNRILMANDNFDWDDLTKSDFPRGTTPLVAGQRSYDFDQIGFLKLKRVDVTWDGTKYYRATPFDSATYEEGLGNDTNTDKNFDKQNPAYDLHSNGFDLYPLADASDVSAGAKARIEFSRAYDEFSNTDTSVEPPIDRPFHDLIAIGAALRYPGLTTDQYNKLQVLWQNGLVQLESHYGTKNEDFSLSINPYLEDYN